MQRSASCKSGEALFQEMFFLGTASVPTLWLWRCGKILQYATMGETGKRPVSLYEIFEVSLDSFFLN